MYRLFKVFVVAPSICYALPAKTLRHQARRFLLSPEVLSRSVLDQRHRARICLQGLRRSHWVVHRQMKKDVTTLCLLPSQRRAPKSNLWKLSLRIRRIPTMPSCFTPSPPTSYPLPATSTLTSIPISRLST